MSLSVFCLITVDFGKSSNTRSRSSSNGIRPKTCFTLQTVTPYPSSRIRPNCSIYSWLHLRIALLRQDSAFIVPDPLCMRCCSLNLKIQTMVRVTVVTVFSKHFSRVPRAYAVRARLFLILLSLLSPLTERNAFYNLFRRHLRPESIIPYQGRKLSARVVTTIGTTRRDYRHDSKVRNKKNQECHHDSLGFHFLTNLLSTIHYSF